MSIAAPDIPQIIPMHYVFSRKLCIASICINHMKCPSVTKEGIMQTLPGVTHGKDLSRTCHQFSWRRNYATCVCLHNNLHNLYTIFMKRIYAKSQKSVRNHVFVMADLHYRITWLLPRPSGGQHFLVLHTKYTANDYQIWLHGCMKFLLWRQLNGCSMTRPFLSLRRA